MARRRVAAWSAWIVFLLAGTLAGCQQQTVPDTTVSDPLSLGGSTLTLASSSGSLAGQLENHQSDDLDPNFLVFDPATVVLTIPVAGATLSGTTRYPSTLTLQAAASTLYLSDAATTTPIVLSLQAQPATWSFQQQTVGGSGYDATGTTDLAVTLAGPDTVSALVGLLTSGGANTARIVLSSVNSTDSVFQGQPGASLEITFGAGTAVFSFNP